MITKDKDKPSKEAGPLPWPAVIVFNLFILALVILLVFGLVKLVKFFWLL